MRKGILSLSLPGRGKVAGKKKTTNMEIAEKSAAKKTPVAEAPAVEIKSAEKAFVQTIMVPKQESAVKVKKRKHGLLGGRITKK